MLLFVTGPGVTDEALAQSTPKIYGELSAQWPALVSTRVHPRTGSKLAPAVTRLDLFLAAFSPAPSTTESGLSIHVPPQDQWWKWASVLRPALRELIVATFPPGLRYGVPFDAVGPGLVHPSPDETTHIRTLASDFQSGTDPSQAAVDPRLWLVLAPPLPEELEAIFLSTFLRAEPFARVARAPGESDRIGRWLENEVDRLIAGKNLVTEGLVVDLEGGTAMPSFVVRDDNGDLKASTEIFDLVSGLEDLYASKEVLGPGEVYNRLHSHSGSEELYIVLEGEGAIRINERLLPIKSGQCFGKPRGYDCSSQILNTGVDRMVFLDIGTENRGEIDLCRYPEHGELLARFGGHRWIVPTEAILPGSELSPVYESRYFRTVKTSTE